MAARFTKLNNAIKAGLAETPVKAAVEQIEYWEDQLKDVDATGAKGITTDLHSLKTKLQAGDVDGDAVVKLLKQLGDKTSKIAGKVDDEKVAEQLENLGAELGKLA